MRARVELGAEKIAKEAPERCGHTSEKEREQERAQTRRQLLTDAEASDDCGSRVADNLNTVHSMEP